MLLTTDQNDDNRRSRLAEAVGRVAIAHSEADEWLVQVLVSLLGTLETEVVQILVGGDTMERKCDRIKAVVEAKGGDVRTITVGDMSLKKLFASVRDANVERDKIVHSFYSLETAAADEFARFRSRNKTPPISLAMMREVEESLRALSKSLESFVEMLEADRALVASATVEFDWLARDAHQFLAVAHLDERGLLDAAVETLRAGKPLRVAIGGKGRRILVEGEAPKEDETIATVHGTNGAVDFVQDNGGVFSYGDTGWRDITAIAREEFPDLQYARIRRVGEQVYFQHEGGGALGTDREARDRLAERAFGASGPGRYPAFFDRLQGFAPTKEDESQ